MAALTLWECCTCNQTYRAKLYRCPRCHCWEFKEAEMPKISRDNSRATMEGNPYMQPPNAREAPSEEVAIEPEVVAEPASSDAVVEETTLAIDTVSSFTPSDEESEQRPRSRRR